MAISWSNDARYSAVEIAMISFGATPPRSRSEHNTISWYQCSLPGGSLDHGLERQDQILLASFRSGHLKTMKFSEGCKSFEMCTNCSFDPISPAPILECLGLTKQDLADDPLLMLDFCVSVRSHGPGLALLTNGGVQSQ
ncbi:uncharacterized protein TNCV_3672831 [Trichonephila clavipes]|nr:uncharacterized protein TNCV_3672831 [Trichonephila clavipes]